MSPKPESFLLRDALIDLSKEDFLVWRNNTGALYETYPSEVKGLFRRGRLVRFGLEGSPDVIGFCRICGRFTGVETKAEKGKARDAQLAWASQAKPAGVIYGLSYTLADIERLVDAHRSICRGHR